MKDSQTTSVLDSTQVYEKYDKSNLLGSIQELSKQVADAWEQTQKITFTPKAQIHNVTILGMGGSGLGGHVIQTALKEQLSVPLTVINDYTLPPYLDEHSIVVLSSYSGTTEEVLAAAKQLSTTKAQGMIIAAGGALLEYAKEHQLPYYQIVPTHNPSNQPRMAIGYSVFGTIGLLQHTGVFKLTDSEVNQVIAAINQMQREVDTTVPAHKNRAKSLAYLNLDRFPLFIGAEFMAGALHVATNQHNENAKAFVTYHVLPELNHHLLEALQFPKLLQSSHVAIFVQSQLYHEQNHRRLELSQEIFSESGIETFQIELTAPTKLAQTFEAITLFGYAGMYLAMLEEIDPTPIPNVESFKKKL